MNIFDYFLCSGFKDYDCNTLFVREYRKNGNGFYLKSETPLDQNNLFEKDKNRIKKRDIIHKPCINCLLANYSIGSLDDEYYNLALKAILTNTPIENIIKEYIPEGLALEA